MKIIAIGRNYAAHAKELNNEIPTKPVIFLKPDTAVLKDNKPFYIPDFSSDIHFEPQITETVVRFRIDGVLQEAGRIPKQYYDNILNRNVIRLL